MTRFSDGSIHKKKVNGRWQWQGLIYKYEDDGRRRSLSKTWGIECSHLTEEERGAGRRHAPKGKGARAALAALREWRASLVEEAGGDGGEAKASGVAAMQMGDFMEAYWATRRIKKSTMKGYYNLKKHIVMLPGRACDVEPADDDMWPTGRESEAGMVPCEDPRPHLATNGHPSRAVAALPAVSPRVTLRGWMARCPRHKIVSKYEIPHTVCMVWI